MIKKINLRGISEILSEKELKNVMGGSGPYPCNNKVCKQNSDCGSGYCGVICSTGSANTKYCA